jgi:hypothetical protein
MDEMVYPFEGVPIVTILLGSGMEKYPFPVQKTYCLVGVSTRIFLINVTLLS